MEAAFPVEISSCNQFERYFALRQPISITFKPDQVRLDRPDQIRRRRNEDRYLIRVRPLPRRFSHRIQENRAAGHGSSKSLRMPIRFSNS